MLVRGDDGSPKLGLIDYGSTKQMSKEKRHLFCKLIIALADDDREAIIRLMKEAGYVKVVVQWFAIPTQRAHLVSLSRHFEDGSRNEWILRSYICLQK